MSNRIASMLRVNYAGELAAVNMYKGQAAVLKGSHHGLIKVISFVIISGNAGT